MRRRELFSAILLQLHYVDDSPLCDQEAEFVPVPCTWLQAGSRQTIMIHKPTVTRAELLTPVHPPLLKGHDDPPRSR